MTCAQEILLTKEGWQRLHGELRSLQERQSSEASMCRELAQAAEPGALASDYLQSEVAPLDRRIAQLEEALGRARPVGPADREPGRVGVGSEVAVRWEDGAEESYVLVGPPEVDLEAGRISRVAGRAGAPGGTSGRLGHGGDARRSAPPGSASHRPGGHRGKDWRKRLTG
jgi:transcription elongation factor GreA